MSRWLRVLNLIMLALFLFSVIVQYNDPDPIRWMAVYGGAAVACIWWLRGTMPRWLPAVAGLAALIWLGFWIPRVLGQVPLREMFREAGMATMAIEEGREAIGLALITIWMAVLAWVPGRRSSTQRAQRPQSTEPQ